MNFEEIIKNWEYVYEVVVQQGKTENRFYCSEISFNHPWITLTNPHSVSHTRKIESNGALQWSILLKDTHNVDVFKHEVSQIRKALGYKNV